MSQLIGALVDQLRTGDVVLVAALGLCASWIIATAARASRLGARFSALSGYRNFASQFGLLLALEQAYEFTRGRIPLRTDLAFIHAYRLLSFEWRHGFFVESRVERFFLPFHTLMTAIDAFYVFGHLIVTIGAMVFIYVCRRRHYPLLRNLMMISTGIALIAFYLYPTAPPRLLSNYGLVDPAQLQHLVSAGGAQPDSYTYNPYAAMPSLHVAYALVVSLVLIVSERRLWLRPLIALYPVAMAATVVISGNHWLLDVVGASATVAVAGVVLFVLNHLGSALQNRLTALRAMNQLFGSDLTERAP